jgi:hypothetical protein
MVMRPGPEAGQALLPAFRSVLVPSLGLLLLVAAASPAASGAAPSGGGPSEEQALRLVLPLSNGVTLGMPWEEVVARCGAASSDNVVAGSRVRHAAFRDFSVIVDVPSTRVVSIRLGSGVRLAGGLGIGSRWAAVLEAFAGYADGEEPLRVELRGARVSFERFGEDVSGIEIRQGDRSGRQSSSGKSRAEKSGSGKSRVWPLSNGVDSAITADGLLARVGPPEQDDRRHPSVRALNYKDFYILFTSANGAFHRLVLVGPGVKLACGLGVGVSEDEVRRVLPQARAPIVGANLRYIEPGLEVRISLRDGVVSRIELRGL